MLQIFFRLFKLHIYGSFLSHCRIQNFVLIYKPLEKNAFFWVHEHIQPLSQEMSFLFLYLSLVLDIGYEKRKAPPKDHAKVKSIETPPPSLESVQDHSNLSAALEQ